MRTVWSGFLSLLAIGLAGSLAFSDGKKPLADDFRGIWLEERKESGGKVYDSPVDLLGWDFKPDDGGCWERRGESVYTGGWKVRIRTDKDPVWLDFISEKPGGKVAIRPGIAKRAGEKLVWVWAKEWYQADAKDVADWPTRPMSFEVTKGDAWEKKTLYRGKERYSQN